MLEAHIQRHRGENMSDMSPQPFPLIHSSAHFIFNLGSYPQCIIVICCIVHHCQCGLQPLSDVQLMYSRPISTNRKFSLSLEAIRPQHRKAESWLNRPLTWSDCGKSTKFYYMMSRTCYQVSISHTTQTRVHDQ